MGANPPFLFDGAPAAVTVGSDFEAEVTVLTVRGRWTSLLWRQAAAASRKCFTEHPSGLIIDLSGLDDTNGRSVPMWLNAQRVGARMEPCVPVALCVPPELGLAHRLQHSGTDRYLPVYAKVRQARVALASRLPLTDRLRLRLVADTSAPARARDPVRQACSAWNLPRLAYPAQLVVSELVSNAVRHTGTGVSVLVTRRGPGLHLAVADGDPRLPRLGDPAPQRHGPTLTEGGRGLQLVHAASAAWGAMPTESGKVVWATVRTPMPGDPAGAAR